MIPSSIRQDEIRSTVKSPTVWTGCEDRAKAIWRLQEAIQHESLKLRELDEEWSRLRRKSVILDEEIRKLNTGGAQMDRAELREPALATVVTFLSWLRPHLTK